MTNGDEDPRAIPRALIENVRAGFMVARYGDAPIGPDELTRLLEFSLPEFETAVRFRMTAAGVERVDEMIGDDGDEATE